MAEISSIWAISCLESDRSGILRRASSRENFGVSEVREFGGVGVFFGGVLFLS